MKSMCCSSISYVAIVCSLPFLVAGYLPENVPSVPLMFGLVAAKPGERSIGAMPAS